jgi:hypothetical protein
MDLHGDALGAIFSTEGKNVVFGTLEDCLLVWDAKNGAVVYGMEHEEGEIASFVNISGALTSLMDCIFKVI